jgi:hypothetical protein
MEVLYVIGGMILLSFLVFGLLSLQIKGIFKRKNKNYHGY